MEVLPLVKLRHPTSHTVIEQLNGIRTGKTNFQRLRLFVSLFLSSPLEGGLPLKPNSGVLYHALHEFIRVQLFYYTPPFASAARMARHA